MKKKINYENLIGKPIYYVGYNRERVSELTIKEVQLYKRDNKEQKVSCKLEVSRPPELSRTVYEYQIGSEYFLSKQKAENVVRSRLEQKQRRRERIQLHDALDEALRKAIPELEDSITEKVYIRTSKSRNEWEVFDRGSLFTVSRYRKGGKPQIAFAANGNVYLLSKEGKNWKQYSEDLKTTLEIERLRTQAEQARAKALEIEKEIEELRKTSIK